MEKKTLITNYNDTKKTKMIDYVPNIDEKMKAENSWFATADTLVFSEKESLEILKDLLKKNTFNMTGTMQNEIVNPDIQRHKNFAGIYHTAKKDKDEIFKEIYDLSQDKWKIKGCMITFIPDYTCGGTHDEQQQNLIESITNAYYLTFKFQKEGFQDRELTMHLNNGVSLEKTIDMTGIKLKRLISFNKEKSTYEYVFKAVQKYVEENKGKNKEIEKDMQYGGFGYVANKVYQSFVESNGINRQALENVKTDEEKINSVFRDIQIQRRDEIIADEVINDLFSDYLQELKREEEKKLMQEKKLMREVSSNQVHTHAHDMFDSQIDVNETIEAMKKIQSASNKKETPTIKEMQKTGKNINDIINEARSEIKLMKEIMETEETSFFSREIIANKLRNRKNGKDEI